MVFPDKIKTAFRQFLFLARVAGFEPADDGIRIRCLTTWRYPNIINCSALTEILWGG